MSCLVACENLPGPSWPVRDACTYSPVLQRPTMSGGKGVFSSGWAMKWKRGHSALPAVEATKRTIFLLSALAKTFDSFIYSSFCWPPPGCGYCAGGGNRERRSYQLPPGGSWSLEKSRGRLETWFLVFFFLIFLPDLVYSNKSWSPFLNSTPLVSLLENEGNFSFHSKIRGMGGLHGCDAGPHRLSGMTHPSRLAGWVCISQQIFIKLLLWAKLMEQDRRGPFPLAGGGGRWSGGYFGSKAQGPVSPKDENETAGYEVENKYFQPPCTGGRHYQSCSTGEGANPQNMRSSSRSYSLRLAK